VSRRNHQLNCEALESRQLLSAYYIVNWDSGKVLDNSLSTIGGTVIDQWQLYGGANQQWNLIPEADGADLIQNAQSGMYLDNGFSLSNFAQIVQAPFSGNTNQQWLFNVGQEPDGNYVPTPIINAYSRLALDNSFSTTNGQPPIDQFQFNGTLNQQWVLLPAGNAVSLAQGAIVNAQNFTSIHDMNATGGPIGQWNIIPLADGFNLIVNVASGFALADPNSSTIPGTAVDTELLYGGLNQEWQVLGQPDGNFVIFNASSRLVLDELPNVDGLPQLDNFYGGLNQEWNFVIDGVDIHGQPSNAVVGQPISPAITVAVVDAKGNTITNDNAQLVTLAIASGPAGAKLLGTTTARAVNGVADFTNLRLSLPGTYTLTATGGALTPDFSNVFTIAPATMASHVKIRRGSVHKLGRTSPRGSGGELVAQTITIKNASRQPLGGPLALRVGRLPTGVTLANASGTYEGSSYRDVLAADQPLAPGKSVTVTLDFSVSGRRSRGLSKLYEDLEALLGI
jgi:hypothetical protein